MKILQAPLNNEDIENLQVGEYVLLQGYIYAARDAAHRNMYESLLKGEELPVELDGQIIYYVGPCPAPPEKIIGSAGPTTSGRMDFYTPALLAKGLKCMVGKGDRDAKVIEAIKQHKAVYLATIGGAGAYLAQKIIGVETIAYQELGAEALLRLEVKDFPGIVAIDINGNNIYERHGGFY